MLDGEPEQQARLKQLCEKMFRSVTLCRDRGFRMRASGTVGGATSSDKHPAHGTRRGQASGQPASLKRSG
eukprot:4873147-Prymnesium_polylepis.1